MLIYGMVTLLICPIAYLWVHISVMVRPSDPIYLCIIYSLLPWLFRKFSWCYLPLSIIIMTILICVALMHLWEWPIIHKEGSKRSFLTVMGSLTHMSQQRGYSCAIPSYTWGVTTICCCPRSVYKFTLSLVCLLNCSCAYDLASVSNAMDLMSVAHGLDLNP